MEATDATELAVTELTAKELSAMELAAMELAAMELAAMELAAMELPAMNKLPAMELPAMRWSCRRWSWRRCDGAGGDGASGRGRNESRCRGLDDDLDHHFGTSCDAVDAPSWQESCIPGRAWVLRGGEAGEGVLAKPSKILLFNQRRSLQPPTDETASFKGYLFLSNDWRLIHD